MELLVLSEILPPTRKGDLPIFGHLVIFFVALMVMSIAESIIVTVIHKTSQRKLPESIDRFLKSRIIKFIKSKNEQDDDTQSVQTQANSQHNEEAVNDTVHRMTGSRSTSRIEHEDGEKYTNNANEWMYLANVIDRLMFIVYFVLLLSGLLYFFISMNI